MANVIVPGLDISDAVVFKTWQIALIDDSYPASSGPSLMLVDGRFQYGMTIPPGGRLVAIEPA